MQDKSHAPKKMIRCAIYTRSASVPTDIPPEFLSNSCEAQESRARSFIENQKGLRLTKIYSDRGFSGMNSNRPCFQKMLGDIRDGLIDRVITSSNDRITRSLKDFYKLIEFFEKHRVSHVSISISSTVTRRAARDLFVQIVETFNTFAPRIRCS